MSLKNITFFIISAGLLCLVWFTIMAATDADKGKTYTNPVLVETFFINREAPDNFSGVLGIGDPTVLFHEGSYYLYPTGDNRGYDVYVSADLVNWRKGPRVFYSNEPGTWAPDVFYDKRDRKFYLYYTVNGRIGVAVSDRPDRVFHDLGILIENAIDAHMFVDDDSRYYLYYVQYPDFKIHVQPMASPVRKQGEAILLLQATEPWERKQTVLTEAPWMLKHRGMYYLLYSAGAADSADYAIGYATAETPIGPFVKNSANPLIKKGRNIYGPGHCSVTRDRAGQLWMVYHQQKDGSRGWNRIICIDPLWFDDQGELHGKATRGVPLPVPIKN
ncbi:MAG: glycoside hydrolase family 43 protein [Deltaproteobacteria bacterium]|jgi:beta-xylosidase|nr:glycoside hydrolase family 43 protein [Deltaproteobacteria bacterium]